MRALFLFAAGVIVGSCNPAAQPPPSLSHPGIYCSFEPNPSDFDEYVKDQDYTLWDQTGLAQSCEVVDGGGGPGPESVLRATPDADRVLTFSLVDGVCGDRQLWLRRAADNSDFEAEIKEVYSSDETARPCPAVARFRTARIQLAD